MYRTKIEKERNQPRKLWGTLNEFTSRSSCKTSTEQVKSENVIIIDKVESCNTFNNCFSSIGGQLAQNFANNEKPS